MSSSTTDLSPALQAALATAIRDGVEKALRGRSKTFRSDELQAEFFTITQARHVLAISRSGIYRLFETGELTPIKRGGRVLIDSVQVLNYADKLRTGASRKSGVPS